MAPRNRGSTPASTPMAANQPQTPTTPVPRREKPESAPVQRREREAAPAPRREREPTPAQSSSAAANAVNRNVTDIQVIAENLWKSYNSKTPQRTKLIDVFMGFLVVLALIQFVYCVIAGNYVGLARSGRTERMLTHWKAVQRLPRRLRRHRRPVRPDCELAHADQPGEQGPVREHIERKVCAPESSLPCPVLG